MRVFEEDHVVLARPWLRFIAVHQHVLRLLRLLGHEAPLHPRRKSGATASAQPRGLHRIDDPLRSLSYRLLHSLITVKLDVLLNISSALPEPPRQHFDFIRMRYKMRHYFTSFPWPARYI